MANIDSELAFLRDAQEGDGKAAREIIASALSEICTDRSYPFLKLTATEDGEYEAEEGHPYTSVEVNVQDSPLAYRCADRFKVTENTTLDVGINITPEYDSNIKKVSKDNITTQTTTTTKDRMTH